MIRIDGSELRLFSEQLAEVPREIRREVRPRLRTAAQALAEEAKANASWSDRIPGAIGVRVSFAGRSSSGITVRVDSRAAPHARPLERGSQGRRSVNRHPVFGRPVWVDQPTRPFLFPAVRAMQPRVVAEIQSVIDDALGKL